MQAIDLQPTARVITTPVPVIHDTRTPVTTTGKTTLWDRIAIAVRAKGYSLSTERLFCFGTDNRLSSGCSDDMSIYIEATPEALEAYDLRRIAKRLKA